VLGVFVDYDFSDISTDVSVLGGLVRAGIDHDHSWSIGARLGWLANPGALWYVTGGYTEARFEAFARVDDVGTVFSPERTFSGYFVGGGIDARLADSNWFLRVEYRFSELDSERIARFDDIRADVEPSMHTGRAVLTYKFSGGWSGWGWGWGQ
jgi:outer membrane immunogenic protein